MLVLTPWQGLFMTCATFGIVASEVCSKINKGGKGTRLDKLV